MILFLAVLETANIGPVMNCPICGNHSAIKTITVKQGANHAKVYNLMGADARDYAKVSKGE
jgi:hypothetical protein